MGGECCARNPVSRPAAWRVSTAAASVLSGALLFLLPKCPLCVAVLLTAATGVGFSAIEAARIRGMLLAFWVAALVLAVVRSSAAKHLGVHRIARRSPGLAKVPT